MPSNLPPSDPQKQKTEFLAKELGKKLSSFTLVANTHVALWKTTLVAVFAAGFFGALMFAVGTNYGSQSYAAGEADLIGTMNQPTSTVSVGSALSVSGMVRNQGTGRAREFSSKFEIDVNATGEVFVNDIQINTSPKNVSLRVGASAELRAQWANVPFGAHSIRLCADINNKILESDETNNCSAPIWVTTQGGTLPPPPLPPISTAGTGVAICPWQGPGVASLGACSDPGGCSLDVYQQNTADGWATVRCAGNASPCQNWQSCQSAPDVQGLTYMAYTVDAMGGLIRYNASPNPYSSVVVTHIGGGGTSWVDEPRNVAGDTTDWQNLQDAYNTRVVGIKWADTGIGFGGGGGQSAGRFTRNSASGQTLATIAQRPKLLFEWIYDNLNSNEKPFGLIGSSGGADAVLSPQVLQSRIKDKIAYTAPVSYPNPFFDLFNTCSGTTPPGTFVTPATGALGSSGIGISKGSGSLLMDYILRTPNQNCANGTMTQAMAAGSSDGESLQTILNGGGVGYKGTLHSLVGTANDSDITNGVVWSAGNLMHHPFFAGAKRVWFESTTEEHGYPLTKQNGPGFTEVYNELIRSLGL